MDREIKFRAFNTEMQKYTKNEFILSSTKGNEITLVGVSIDGDPDDSNEEVIFEQFTGLKDKNGKEIYEGDVLKTVTDKPMIVGWSDKFASFILNREGWVFSHWFGESCNPEDCEVIGNIHENPELL